MTSHVLTLAQEGVIKCCNRANGFRGLQTASGFIRPRRLRSQDNKGTEPYPVCAVETQELLSVGFIDIGKYKLLILRCLFLAVKLAEDHSLMLHECIEYFLSRTLHKPF